jgi:hypothetical protein
MDGPRRNWSQMSHEDRHEVMSNEQWGRYRNWKEEVEGQLEYFIKDTHSDFVNILVIEPRSGGLRGGSDKKGLPFDPTGSGGDEAGPLEPSTDEKTKPPDDTDKQDDEFDELLFGGNKVDERKISESKLEELLARQTLDEIHLELGVPRESAALANFLQFYQFNYSGSLLAILGQATRDHKKATSAKKLLKNHLASLYSLVHDKQKERTMDVTPVGKDEMRKFFCRIL